MSFRILNQRPVYLDSNGNPCAGGTLSTYETGTFTPKDSYADPALTVNNGPTVSLNASGRTNVDVWSTGVLRVIVRDQNDVVVFDSDNTQADSEIPDQSGQSGKYLTTDGTALAWGDVSQVPSVTGEGGKSLINDGSDYFWGAPGLGAGAGGAITDWVTSNVRELVQSVTAATTTNLDYALGGAIFLSQAADITSLTFTNLPSSGEMAIFSIERHKDATGTARAITWPSAIKWPGGIAPTLTQTSAGWDEITLKTTDGGVTWAGSYNTALG